MKKMVLKGFGLFALSCLSSFLLFQNTTYAQDVDGFKIIPEIKDAGAINTKIEEIGSKGGKVREKYTTAADQMEPEEQIVSGIMNWDTILNYLVFVVKFLSQLGLLVGVMFIMYAGYKYMVSVFVGGKTNGAPSTLKNAIIGVIIVIFSYAIMKTLTSFIGIS